MLEPLWWAPGLTVSQAGKFTSEQAVSPRDSCFLKTIKHKEAAAPQCSWQASPVEGIEQPPLLPEDLSQQNLGDYQRWLLLCGASLLFLQTEAALQLQCSFCPGSELQGVSSTGTSRT